MTPSVLPNMSKAAWDNKHIKSTYFKTLNPKSPNPVHHQTPIFNLNSYSKTELKELKDKFISKLKRIHGVVKKIEARLDQLEDVENPVKKSSKITGQKRTMPVTPERENKRKRLVKTIELNSMETRKVEMMRECGVILDKLMKHRHGWVFNEPVDVVALGLLDYHQIVKRPMDLGTIKSKLGKRVYKDPLDFAKDVRLTFDNALLYNGKGEEVHTTATVLLGMFDKLFDPAYEKFEVECQRTIVEPKKFSKPQVVSCPVRMHQESELPKKICKEAAKISESKQVIRTVAEEKEIPPRRKEMSMLERDQVGFALQELAEDYLDEILQIVAKRNSNATTPDGDGEIELDIQALDSETMWDLHRFATLKLKAELNNKHVKS